MSIYTVLAVATFTILLNHTSTTMVYRMVHRNESACFV